MHGIGYGIESNGGAYRGNPAWRLVQGYYDFEAGVLTLLLILAGIAFAIFIVIAFIETRQESHEQNQKQLEEQKKEAMEREKRRIEDLEWEEYEREQRAKHAQRKEASASAANVTLKNENVQTVETKCPEPKTITADELKRRAVEQFTRGK